MKELEEDLNAVSSDLVDDAERLRAIELEKNRLTAGDPRIAALADEANALLRVMTRKGESERQVAVEAESELKP